METYKEFLKVGDIIILNRCGENANLLSSLQRFFTGMPYTHVAIVAGKFMNNWVVLTADALINLLPFENYMNEKDTQLKVYRPNGVYFDNIIEKLYKQYTGTSYGYTQVFYFIYRWFMEKLGKDVRLKRNYWSMGTICSELVWYYFRYLGITIPKLRDKINEWTPNTIHAGDINLICESLPDIFTLIYTRNYENS